MFTRSIELYRAYNTADNERSRGFHRSAFLSRGMAYKENGQPDRALEDFTAAIVYDPGLVSAYIYRAELFWKAGNSGSALKDYRTACDLGNEDGCAGSRPPERGK